jgi:hypothetical protein
MRAVWKPPEALKGDSFNKIFYPKNSTLGREKPKVPVEFFKKYQRVLTSLHT